VLDEFTSTHWITAQQNQRKSLSEKWLITTSTPPPADWGIAQELLFQPFRLGRNELRHGMLMAPLTRSRARQTEMSQLRSWRVITRSAFQQRSSSPKRLRFRCRAPGHAWTAGIHSRDQIEGWRLVTNAVHQCSDLSLAYAGDPDDGDRVLWYRRS
jgi:hypothetical protein